MTHRGSFVVLENSVSGGGEAIVAVPGNADVLVLRSEATAVDVIKVDDDHVTVALPAESDVTDFLNVLNQAIWVFGAPAEDEIGWIAVTAKGILGMADSSDEGPNPDYVPVTGTITLVPEVSGPIRLVSSGRFFAVAGLTCTFDSDGELSYDGGKNVRVVSPLWQELSNQDWRWVATVAPGFDQSWTPFTVPFTGAPGSVVNLANLLP